MEGPGPKMEPERGRSHGANIASDCKSCGSKNLKKFPGEIAVHFPGLKNIDRPAVFVFPELVICQECGNGLFVVPEAELRQLMEGDAAAG